MRLLGLIVVGSLPLLSCKERERSKAVENKATKSMRGGETRVRSEARDVPYLPSAEPFKFELRGDWGVLDPGGYGMSRAMSDSEVKDAFEKVKKFPLSRNRERMLGSLIGVAAKNNVALAQELLASWDNALIADWLDAARGVISSLAKTDPQAAISFIENSVPRAAQAEQWIFLLRSFPVEERAAYFERIPEGRARLTAASDMLHPWLEVDVSAATRWLDDFATGLSKGELGLVADRHTYGAVKGVSAETAMDGYRLAEGAEAREMLANFAWSQADEETKDYWYLELSETLPNLLERMWEQQLYSDPAATAKALSSEQLANLDRRVAYRLFNRWGEQNLHEALEWGLAQQRPEVATLLSEFDRLDPKEAFEMAQRMPSGAELDRSLKSVIGLHIHFGRTERARQFLPLISSEKTREKLLKDLAEAEQSGN